MWYYFWSLILGAIPKLGFPLWSITHQTYEHRLVLSNNTPLVMQFFGKSSDKMVEFLQSSVGIIHKNHAESITIFIKESVDEELKESAKPTQKRRITLCVEGNISVGKTTFLQRIANETLELRDLVEIVPEPVDKWQNVGPDHFNILDAFYAEPERYAYTFQNYVFVTRVMQERESCGGMKPLRLMERSVFSDRMVKSSHSGP